MLSEWWNVLFVVGNNRLDVRWWNGMHWWPLGYLCGCSSCCWYDRTHARRSALLNLEGCATYYCYGSKKGTKFTDVGTVQFIMFCPFLKNKNGRTLFSILSSECFVSAHDDFFGYTLRVVLWLIRCIKVSMCPVPGPIFTWQSERKYCEDNYWYLGWYRRSALAKECSWVPS